MPVKGHRTSASIPGPSALLIPGIMLLSMLGIYGLMVFEVVEFNLAYIAAYFLGLAVYVVTLLNIKAGLAILIITMGLSPEYSVGEISNLRLEDFLIPVILLGWFTQVISRREEPVENELRGPMLLYFLLALVSTLKNVIYSDLSFITAFLHFFKIMSYFLIFLVVLNNIRTEREIKALIWVVLGAAGIVGGYGLLQMVGIVSSSEAQFLRLEGPVGETGNIIGGYFTFHILLAVGMLVAIENRAQKFVIAGLILVILVPLAFTLSRTSFVALLGGLIAIGALRHRQVIVWTIIGLPIMALILPNEILARAETIFLILSPEPPPSWTARLQMWNWALDRIISNPLIGGGIASHPLGGMDNEFVKQANDLGLIGLGVYLFILFLIGRTAFQEMRKSDNMDPTIRGFVYGFVGAFVATMVHCVGATTLSAIRTGETFFFVTGLLYAMRKLRLEREGSMELLRTRVLEPLRIGANRTATRSATEAAAPAAPRGP